MKDSNEITSTAIFSSKFPLPIQVKANQAKNCQVSDTTEQQYIYNQVSSGHSIGWTLECTHIDDLLHI